MSAFLMEQCISVDDCEVSLYFLCMCVCVFVCGGVAAGGWGVETKSTAHILKQDLLDLKILYFCSSRS